MAVCGDVDSISVAGRAAMMILAVTKRARRCDASAREGSRDRRNELESGDVQGRDLLTPGYGRVGGRTASMVAGFGIGIRTYDPCLAMRGRPDVISVSVPGTDGPLAGPAKFAAMKDGAVVVNAACGGSVDGPDRASRSGGVGAAGFDAFAREPLPDRHPLRTFDQVVLGVRVSSALSGNSHHVW